MFHALASGYEVAVDDVNRASLAGDDRGIMIAAVRVPLQMPGPFPGSAFIVGNGHSQAATPLSRVVVDQQPVARVARATGQSHRIQAGTRAWKVRHTDRPPGD